MDSLTLVLVKMVSVQHLMVANGLIDSGISGIYENGTILLINSRKDFCNVAYRIQNYETRIMPTIESKSKKKTFQFSKISFTKN